MNLNLTLSAGLASVGPWQAGRSEVAPGSPGVGSWWPCWGSASLPRWTFRRLGGGARWSIGGRSAAARHDWEGRLLRQRGSVSALKQPTCGWPAQRHRPVRVRAKEYRLYPSARVWLLRIRTCCARRLGGRQLGGAAPACALSHGWPTPLQLTGMSRSNPVPGAECSAAPWPRWSGRAAPRAGVGTIAAGRARQHIIYRRLRGATLIPHLEPALRVQHDARPRAATGAATVLQDRARSANIHTCHSAEPLRARACPLV